MLIEVVSYSYLYNFLYFQASYDTKVKLDRMSGASAISSADLFGDDQRSGNEAFSLRLITIFAAMLGEGQWKQFMAIFTNEINLL